MSARPLASRTFRLFVSSTFADMVAERNALARHVFPRLRELCGRAGFRFQAIDLRWGIRDEAARDHRTMRICLDEVERCRSLTPRPNFIALLGNRYGWCPLPSEIPAEHFSAILDKTSSDRERKLFRTWYTPDRNAVPERFWLRPVPQGLDGWSSREAELRAVIRAGISGQRLLPREQVLYFGSATEQEIERACAGGVEPGQAFGFFREIPDPEALVASASPEAVRDFFDLEAGGRLDTLSWRRQETLKETLARLCGATFRYESRWTGPTARRRANADETCGEVVKRLAGRLETLSRALSTEDGEIWRLLAHERELALARLPEELEAPHPGSPLSLRHLPALCADTFLALGRTLTEEIARAGRVAPSAIEGAIHEDFGLARIAATGGEATFEGRKAELQALASYLSGPGGSALAVIGEGGAGKTSLLAQAAAEARRDLPGAEILLRFIGATPTASEGRSLLRDVCAEIAARYPGEAVTVPDDLKGCAELFARLLERGTAARPLVLFLDALDQLPALDEARNLRWLPAELPPSARIVVSCLRGELEPGLARKVPPANRIVLGPMSRAEGERLLDAWLAAAGRTLQPAQRDRILDGFAAHGLPLYLKLAFEEARSWRSEDLPLVLRPEIPDLLRDLFARLSAETHHGPVLVSHALGLLAAARHGLTEDEILDVLSADREVFGDFLARSFHQPPEPSLPAVVWARLYADLRPYLTERDAGGVPVFTFYHRQVGETVAATYGSGAAGRARHAALARYFRRQPERLSGDSGLNLRKLGELPYQQTEASLWRGLARTLLDPAFLQAKAEAGLALDGLDDFVRARLALAREGRESPLARSVAELLSELARAYGQELVAFSAAPSSTAAQIYGNLFAHHGEDGALGKILSRFSRLSPYPGDGVWLRRASRAPGTSLPRELLRTLDAHAGPATGLAVSPSGDRIASSGLDGAVRVWQTSNGSLLADLRHPCPVLSVAWPSLDGGEPWLVTAGRDSCLRVWAWLEERELSCWQAHGDRIRSLTALGGSLVASGGDDRWVKVWDLANGNEEEVARFSGHDGRVLAVAGSSRRNLLLSGSEDMTIRIWDLASRRWTGTLRGHVGDVRCLAVAENGLWAASGGDDRTVRLWHLGEQRARQVLTGHRGSIAAVAIGALNGTAVPVAVSGSDDETLGLWLAAEGARLRSFHGHTGPLGAVGIDPAGSWIASAGDDGSVRFWAGATDAGDLDSWQEHSDLVACVAQRSTPGGFFAVTGSRDRTARVWQGDGLEHLLTFRGHLGPVSAALCLDDERIATGGSDGRIWVWSRRDGRRIRRLGNDPLADLQAREAPAGLYGRDRERGHTQAVTCLALPAPGRLLSAARDGTARLWDVETGDLLRICSAPLGPVERIVVHPGTGLVAGAGPLGHLFVWNPADETLVGTWKGHDSAVTCLAVTGDGRLASCSRDHRVTVWPLDDPGREPLVLAHHRVGVFSLAAAPRGNLLVSGGAEGEIALWDLEAGPPPRVVAAHAGKVQALALDPGLELVYSAGSDGRVAVTELATGRVIATYQTGAPITALAVSSQDRILFGTRRGMIGLLVLCGR